MMAIFTNAAFSEGLLRNKWYRIGEVILLFFKAKILLIASLLKEFLTQKKSKRTRQNVLVIF